MSSGHKTATVFLTLICTLILIITGLCLRWPVWFWPALLTVLAGGAALAVKVSSSPRRPGGWDFPEHPDLPVPTVERWERSIAEVALPSAVEDYDFLMSATVRWRPLDAPDHAPGINPGALAVDTVLARARDVTARQNPYHSTLAQHQLDGVLGTMQPDSTNRVEAMAENVTLQLSDADRERLSKLSTVRKDEDVWEHERNYERSKRTYLGNEVLKDTGSAVVWWMAKHDDLVEKAVELIGPLAQLSSAANNKPVPGLFRHLVPSGEDSLPGAPRTAFGDPANGLISSNGSLAALLPQNGGPDTDGSQEPDEPDLATALAELMDDAGLPDDEPVRALCARRIADSLAAEGCTEAATAIRQRFDAPEPPAGADNGPDTDPAPIGGL